MRRSPVETVLTGIVTKLRASTDVNVLVSTRVYNDVPQNEPYPYVVVSSPTDRREDTLGRAGASVLVDVKAVSQWRGDKEAAQIIERCIGALDMQSLSTTGHTTLGIAFENGDRYAEVVNGIVTRHHVATFRAWTEQSSS